MSSGRTIAVGVFLITLLSWGRTQVDCSRCHTDYDPALLSKSMGLSEKAVGVMDKGQLQNNTSNFGDLASFHVWFTNAVHWPRSAEDDHQYGFGLGLLVGINDTNVIETVTQTQTKVQDWLPPDDAAGRHFSGDIRAVSDETPFQASSDYLDTWPEGYYSESGSWVTTGKRTWPGWFRIDVKHPDFPNTRTEVENEFTSDRDIYCVFNDDYNARGKVGIEVEQTAYSYGRPYAEDFVFWEFLIHNTSGQDLEDIRIGLYAKFRPDYDNHDYINFIDSDGNGRKDLIYIYDLNNKPDKTWAESDAPLGMVGLRIYDTPEQRGITDFHHFARGVSPTTDEELWAIMASDRGNPALKDSSYYFHGKNKRFDYVGEDSLESFYPPWSETHAEPERPGDGINCIISCGPFTLEAGGTVPLSLGLIMGDAGSVPDEPDISDLMANVQMANEMYQLAFQGSGPPAPPLVQAVADDRSALLYWSAEPSESARDILTGNMDFEGYKVFRSTDQGRSWGKEITDTDGSLVGYKPIAIFDLVNEVEGFDPAFPQNLGTNSGLVHTFTDSNLINGMEYWYCVTAYDHGNQNPDSLEPSYMYPLGASSFEPHTVAVIPGPRAENISNPVIPTDDLTPIGGPCDALVSVQLVDPQAILSHGYKVIIDTLGGTVFTLIDTTAMDTLLYKHALTDESGDNIPVVDGFRLTVQETEPGVKFLGWTKVHGDTCTFDWYSTKKTTSVQEVDEVVIGDEDFKIIVVDDLHATTDIPFMDGVFTDKIYDSISVPIQVHKITDPQNPVDVSSFMQVFDLRNYFPVSDLLGPLGWDLIPGGAGYNPSPATIWPDIITLRDGKDETANEVWLKTQNGPSDAVPPSVGDEFTIITNKFFRPGISYSFGTTAANWYPAEDSVRVEPLANVRVVPDPYIVTNAWETSEFGKKLQFTNLPSECTIKIFTLAGEHVSTIEHYSGLGYTFWDMRNKNDQFIAPGVYLYAISTPKGDKALGRFLVIK
ncbi:MAG: hypothetical protein JSW54_13185 [Fidelibacterota bacterium]|nr:MAG: hypothetical protein JSW54_13185 [Candidatus Neomarinimicrobiota bacterium]